jgi:hypothetical protein
MLMIGRFMSEMAELNQSSARCRDGCRSWVFREYWVYLLEIDIEVFISQIRFLISRLRVQDSESCIFPDDEVISSKHIRIVIYDWRSVLQTLRQCVVCEAQSIVMDGPSQDLSARTSPE